MTWNPFARKPALDIRPGQESVQSDDMAGVFGRLQGIYTFASPSYELEKLGLLELLGKYNPDVSQALKIHVDLGNSGHSIEVEARNAEAVLDRINWLAANCYSLAGGVDGLVNHFLRQIPLMGALSAEWVVAPALSDGMLDVVIVPVKQIRFRHEDGQWMPYQATGRGFGEAGYVPLNPRTYSYAPTMTEDGKPYALPGLLAALKNIEIQLDAVEGIKSIIRKMGLLGFLDVVLKVPQQKAGESDESFRSRLQSRLKAYAESYKANMSKGVSVHYDDQEAKHTALSAGTAAGAAQIFNLNEEQIFSALDIPPSMAGRSFSTTETYATVDFQRLATKLLNSQRLIKRFLEKGYTLDLLLRGIDASVSVNFNPIAGMNDKEAAETEEIRVKTILSKRDGGIINDDEAAQELGYEKATGTRPVGEGRAQQAAPLRFTYNRQAGRYQFTPERIVLEQPADDRRDQSYVAALQAVYIGPQEAAVMAALARAKEIAGKDTTAQTFAREVFSAFKEKLQAELAGSAVAAVIDQHVGSAWRHYRYEDTNHLQSRSPRSQRLAKRQARFEIDISVVDVNALRYLTTLDNWYFGKGNMLADDKAQGLKFINWLQNEYIKKGLSIKDASTWSDFAKEFPALVKASSNRKITQLVSTTMSRVQNMGQTLSLYEDGWDRYIIVGPKDSLTCDYCRSMVGRLFSVHVAAERLANILETGFETPQQLPPFLSSSKTIDEVKKMSDEELEDAGFETPPYHPECRHRKTAYD